MATFRLLHISDLHISIPPEEDEIGSRSLWISYQWICPTRARRPLLEAAADLVHDMRDSLDTIIISGDLSDDGEDRNLDSANDFLRAKPDSEDHFFTPDGFPTLCDSASSEAPLFVLPGNHDRFRTITRLPGGTRFDEKFKEYWKKGIGGVQSLTIDKEDASLALISADFCLRHLTDAPLNAWGQGLANERTISLLEKLTQETRMARSSIGIIWILHFPPFLDVENYLRLRNAEQVLEAARRSNVAYIIAGHLHRNQTVPYDGLEVICTGTATSDHRAFRGNWIRLLEVSVRGAELDVTSNMYRYIAAEAKFVDKKAGSPKQGTPAVSAV